MLLFTSKNAIWDTRILPLTLFPQKAKAEFIMLLRKHLYEVVGLNSCWLISVCVCTWHRYRSEVKLRTEPRRDPFSIHIEGPPHMPSNYMETVSLLVCSPLISYQVPPRDGNWTGWHWSTLLQCSSTSILLFLTEASCTQIHFSCPYLLLVHLAWNTAASLLWKVPSVF